MLSPGVNAMNREEAMVLLAELSSVREELDRLRSHLAALEFLQVVRETDRLLGGGHDDARSNRRGCSPGGEAFELG